jgi:hypothetical protein
MACWKLHYWLRRTRFSWLLLLLGLLFFLRAANVGKTSDRGLLDKESLYVSKGDYSRFFKWPHLQHPINELILAAETEFQNLLSKRTTDYSSTLAAYQARRGRPPPPGFAQWFSFAIERNAVLIEPFWDQIYQDLQPFGDLDPRILQTRALTLASSNDHNGVHGISVRDGKATWTHLPSSTAHVEYNKRCAVLLDMVRSLEPFLPDMDIPCNGLIAPRLFVPSEQRGGTQDVEESAPPLSCEPRGDVDHVRKMGALVVDPLGEGGMC